MTCPRHNHKKRKVKQQTTDNSKKRKSGTIFRDVCVWMRILEPRARGALAIPNAREWKLFVVDFFHASPSFKSDARPIPKFRKHVNESPRPRVVHGPNRGKGFSKENYLRNQSGPV